MPRRPSGGQFPLILRNHDVKKVIDGELLLDYNNYDLYFVKPSTGERIPIARELYDRIMAAKVQNTGVQIVNRDQIDPLPNKDDIIPAIKDREYNTLYISILGRQEYTFDENKVVLTAQPWTVKEDKTFYGKNSNYKKD